MRANHPGFIRNLFPVLALLLSISITLGILELIAWLVFHQSWPRQPVVPISELAIETVHGKRLLPNLDAFYYSHLSKKEIHFRTNGFGFRGKNISLDKKSGVTRIIVLGDSIVLANFLPPEELITTLLENKLSAFRPVEVINAGVANVGLEEERWILKETGIKLHPDLVIVGFYLNDSRSADGIESQGDGLPARAIKISRSLEQYSYLYKWIWRRFLVKRFVGKDQGALQEWRKEYRAGGWKTDRKAYQDLVKSASWDWGAAWEEDSWKEIYRELDELRSLAEQNQFQLAIMVFPVAVQVRSSVADDYPQKKMLSYCSRAQIPCLDLLPWLKSHRDEEIFFDHCHLTAQGNRIVADALAEFIRDIQQKSK